MPPKMKYTLICVSLLAACYFVYGMPRAKYVSPQILSKIQIPFETAHWKSRDMSEELNLNDKRYRFAGGFLARVYANDLGESLLFLVVDAINFHHPRGCFDSSGYMVHSMGEIPFQANGHSWLGQAYFMEKGNQSQVVVFWICIDKKVVNWAQQRLEQLAYSLFGKKKIGFMVRMDIPARKESKEMAIDIAKDFVKNVLKGTPEKDAGHLMGKS